MLVETDIFGNTVDKVQVAIARLKLHEPKEGYYVAFSGGKDSCVILDLCKRAGVKFDAHYNLTTIDPPDVVYFIRDNYPEVEKHLPEKTMWELIVEKGSFPMRQIRYCCQELKERGGEGRSVVVTGVRAAESARRAKRGLFEPCRSGRRGAFLHPIMDWSHDEVWEYIKKYNVPYCKLYDEGFERIGCVLCPFAKKSEREMHLKRFPKIAKCYLAAGKRMWKNRIEKGKPFKNFDSPEEMFEWWISGKSVKDFKGREERNIFGLIMDESML